MKVRRTTTWVVCACLVASRAIAQTAIPTPGAQGPHLTLEAAVTEALANAPGLQAAAAQDRAARWNATAVGRTRFGQLDGVLSYSRFQDDQILRPMSKQLFGAQGFLGLPWDSDQVHYGITFQVPVYTGGRLSSSIRIAALQAEQASLFTDGTRWDIRANTTALYAAVQTLDAVTVALDRSIEALAATDGRLTLMVEQGRRPRLDLLKVEEELEDARGRRAGIVADRTRVGALLLAVIGRDPASRLDVSALPEINLTSTLGGSDVATLARATSAVRRAELGAEQSREAVAAARGARLPNVVLRGNLMGNVGLSIGDQLRTWELSVAVTVPVFDGGARAAAAASARELAVAGRAAATRALLDREAQVVDAQARFTAAGDSLKAARARVAAAAEAARIEQVRYDTGVGTVEDLLRVRAREFAAASALAQARGDQITAAARLNALSEKEIVQ
ncbi:MAG: TolC family protein [Acidobacteria bacterium]|nr:TolC family protein [Acidobacteriota bacterium]